MTNLTKRRFFIDDMPLPGTEHYSIADVDKEIGDLEAQIICREAQIEGFSGLTAQLTSECDALRSLSREGSRAQRVLDAT